MSRSTAALFFTISTAIALNGCATQQQTANIGAAASSGAYSFRSEGDQWLDVVALPQDVRDKYYEQFPVCVDSANRLVNAIARDQASAAANAVAGAIAGALIGALLMPRGYRNYGAQQGAVAGGVGAGAGTMIRNAADAELKFNNALGVCLRNAGFALLR